MDAEDAVPKTLEDWDHRWHGVAIASADWHFHRRLFERYHSLVLPPGSYSKMITRIRAQHRKAYLLRQRDERSSLWAVWVNNLSKGQIIIVVYDAQTRRAVTALPFNTEGQKLYRRARARRAALRQAAEAAGEEIVSTINLAAVGEQRLAAATQ